MISCINLRVLFASISLKRANSPLFKYSRSFWTGGHHFQFANSPISPCWMSNALIDHALANMQILSLIYFLSWIWSNHLSIQQKIIYLYAYLTVSTLTTQLTLIRVPCFVQNIGSFGMELFWTVFSLKLMFCFAECQIFGHVLQLSICKLDRDFQSWHFAMKIVYSLFLNLIYTD